MTELQRPWYKEPYVWMLIGFPFTSIVVGLTLLTISIQNKDTLVRDNYYKDGLAYNQELQWDKKAVSLDIAIEMQVTGNQLRIELVRSRQTPPNTLKVTLGHPTMPDKDRESHLQQTKDKQYVGFIEPTENGRYYLLIESIEQQWRIRKDVQVKNGESIIL